MPLLYLLDRPWIFALFHARPRRNYTMGNNDLNRDVRTLLFGKIAPAPHENDEQSLKDHDTLYRQIYNLPPDNDDLASSDSAYTFLTFGGYDAIRVYQPKLDVNDSKWLHKIYEDKQRIIQMPSNDIIYHQMHVVSQHPDTREFWADQRDEEYPFFLATLIYGVNVNRLDDAMKEYAVRHKGEDPYKIFLGSSTYEKIIRLHLDQHLSEKKDQVRYAIYNGITVADVVVLWRARNLKDALDALRYIEYSGVARKTLTTLGFPVDADGRIKRCVTDNLIENMDQIITVSIQGSVRDFTECMAMRDLLKETLPGSTCKGIQNQSRKLLEALESTPGGVTDDLRCLSRELAEEAANTSGSFTDTLMQRVRALAEEADRQSEYLPANIDDAVDELVTEAKEQSRNTIDKIERTVHELAGKGYDDLHTHAKLRNAVHDGELKSRIDNCHIRAHNQSEYFENIKPLFSEIYQELSCGMYDLKWMQSLGKSDFTATAQINYANLANLLEIYRKHHKELSNACWEFLTDVKIDQPVDGRDDYWIKESKRPTNVMCKLYSDFQKLCPKKEEAESDAEHKLDLRQFSWYNALQELLGTHHYVDHHPVLHGPSYLVYTSLKIAYAYFAGLVPDYESVEKRTSLLKRSEENIIDFIRNLDQLTEQISRNDDAMLNNRSNTHTIHFSLPESALEFYHAFLRRIVNFLIQFDRDEELVPEGFEYDFLLSPKTCGSFRFRPMLRTEHKDHNDQAGMVWPQKQAYILELPLESIFNPIDIFIPFVHESFHCFGDILRQRKRRKKYMAMFIASNMLNVVGMNRPEYKDFCGELAWSICPLDQTDYGSYLTTSWQQLVHNTEKLLAEDTLEGLNRKFGGRVEEDVLLLWLTTKHQVQKIDTRTSLFAERMTVCDAILKNCNTYFKECYADAMTVALLQLTPEEYMRGSRDELRRFHYKYNPWAILDETSIRVNTQRAHLAQRFAIVLATCCFVQNEDPKKRLPDFTVGNCLTAIEGIGDPKVAPIDEDVDYKAFTRILKQSFESLIDSRKPMPPMSALHPPTTLRYVIDYLRISVRRLYEKQTSLTIPGYPNQKYTGKELAEQFDKVIRQGNMFGEDFYKLIYSHHDEIRNVVKPKKASDLT